MQLRVVKSRTKAIAKFSDEEWRNADVEHYGSVQDFSEELLRVVAREGKRIVGTLKIKFKRGVGEVQTVLVAQNTRGTGVGSVLMKKVEELARERKVHKLWLETGKGWKAERFYEKHGYRKNTILPKHYAGHDFVLYEKLLK